MCPAGAASSVSAVQRKGEGIRYFVYRYGNYQPPPHDDLEGAAFLRPALAGGDPPWAGRLVWLDYGLYRQGAVKICCTGSTCRLGGWRARPDPVGTANRSRELPTGCAFPVTFLTSSSFRWGRSRMSTRLYFVGGARLRRLLEDQSYHMHCHGAGAHAPDGGLRYLRAIYRAGVNGDRR